MQSAWAAPAASCGALPAEANDAMNQRPANSENRAEMIQSTMVLQ